MGLAVHDCTFFFFILPAPALGQVWWKGKGPLWYSVNYTQTPVKREGTKRAQTVVHT